jgi:putative Mg2+ transporter-C (MgtC) family protein
MFSYQQIFLRLTLASLCGAAIGIERDVHRRPAGVRTSAFVCMGAALFTVLSFELSRRYGDSSSTRIASNLVQGIGFLGAGAILREGGGLVGLTTAATIFVEAAIGMAFGGGLYAIGGFATGVVLFGLVVVGWFTHWANLKPRILEFRITAEQHQGVGTEVQRLLEALRIKPQQFRISMAGTNTVIDFQAEVGHRQQEQIVHQLNRAGVVTEIVPFEGHHD